MSLRTPKMARPSQMTPKGSRNVLSVETLMRSPSLKPIIASRGAGRPDELRSNLSTPRNMYDCEDRSTIAPTYSSETLDLSVHSSSRDYLHPSMDPVLESPVMPYRTQPRASERVMYPYDRHVSRRTVGYTKRRGHAGRRKRHGKPFLAASTCYIFLKALEMLSCAAILAVSRICADDLSQDYMYTILAACGLIAAGLGLLVLWVRGHPAPDDCVHTTMLLVYCLAAPVLLCGGILVLQLSDANTSVIIVATLFFGSTFLFCVDILVMTTAMLQCYCCCCACCHPPLPDHQHRVYPDSHQNIPKHQGSHHPQLAQNMHSNSLKYGNGHPGYPRSLPQMSMR